MSPAKETIAGRVTIAKPKLFLVGALNPGFEALRGFSFRHHKSNSAVVHDTDSEAKQTTVLTLSLTEIVFFCNI